MRHTAQMSTSASLYHGHRFPTEIISHCVWLSFRFSLSYRDVEECYRCVALNSLTRQFVNGVLSYANALRSKSLRSGDRWHCDEVLLKINGRVHYLWRAVNQDGDVLDILSGATEIRKRPSTSFASC